MSLSLIALPILFAVLKVASIAAAGFLLGKKSILHDSATSDISDLVIKVAVPCLVFTNAAGGLVGLSSTSAAALVIAGPAVIGAGYALSVVMAKVFRVDPAYRTAVVATSAFQNSAYLPLAVCTAVAPLVVQAAGLPAMPNASGAAIVCISLFGVLYSPIFWGIGLGWIVDDIGTPPPLTGEGLGGRGRWRQIATRMLPPPVIGLIVGYVVAFTPLRELFVPHDAPLRFLFDAAGDIGGMTVPLANLILGAMLARAGAGRNEPVRNYLIVIATRFVIVPALFLSIAAGTRAWWISSPAAVIAAFVIFLQSITPPATNLAVMSKGVRESSPHHTAEAIPRILLVTYLLCLLTMPAWLIVFLHLLRTR